MHLHQHGRHLTDRHNGGGGCYRGLVRIQGITVEVSDLIAARAFYENLLGFQPGEYYAPTKWQPYEFGGQYFAIREIKGKKPHDDFDITNFELDQVADVERLWAAAKDVADVAEPLATTPYGTYKFVVRDPDGYRIGFVARRG
jgi:catechol 2,3-dioxygenase-like lactoylglutathione lyase family enzyme